jgi:hypothetical protein
VAHSPESRATNLKHYYSVSITRIYNIRHVNGPNGEIGDREVEAK